MAAAIIFTITYLQQWRPATGGALKLTWGEPRQGGLSPAREPDPLPKVTRCILTQVEVEISHR